MRHSGMVACPACGHESSWVTQTRGSRRNRRCGVCHVLFTTYEINAEAALAAGLVGRRVGQGGGKLPRTHNLEK